MTMQNTKPIIYLFILMLSALCFCQTEGTSDAEPAAATNAGTQIDTIQTQIEKLQADTTIDAETKQKLLDAYRSTVEQNRLAASMSQKSQAFIKSKNEAPEKIAALKNNIDQPVKDDTAAIPTDATLEVLSQMLTTAEGKLDVAKKQAESVKSEIEFRKNRQTEILELSAKADSRLQEIGDKAETKTPPVNASQFDLAIIEQNKAVKKAVEQEIELYKNETASYKAEAELLKLRSDSTAAQIKQAEETVKKLQELVNAKRKQEAEKAAKEATEAVDMTDPAVKHIAEENKKLAELRTAADSPASKMISLTQRQSQAAKRLKSLKDSQSIVEEKIEAAGLTKMIGILLQKQKKDLTNRRTLKNNINKTQSEISFTQQRMIEIKEQIQHLGDIDEQVNAIVGGLDDDTNKYRKNNIERTARQLLQTQREYLDALYGDHDTYFNKLYDLYELQIQLLTTTRDYRNFINENILWFKSYNTLGRADIPYAVESAKWLCSGQGWKAAGKVITQDAVSNPAYYIFCSALSLILLARIRKVNGKLETLSARPEMKPDSLFKYTIRALIYGFQLSVTIALPVLLVSWRLTLDASANEFPRAAGFGLISAASVWVALEFLNKLFAAKGIGQTHLNWHALDTANVTGNLRSLRVILLPATFVYVTLLSQSKELYHGSLGRAAFIIAMVAVSVCIYRILHPSKNIGKVRLRNLMLIAGTAVPLIIAAIAAIGYYYTAYVLAVRLLISMWLVLAVSITDSLLRRWLYVVKWNMAVKKYERQKAEAKDKDGIDKAVEKAAEPKISDLGEQARKLQKTFISILLIVGLWLIWVDVLPALGILDRVEIWSHTVKQNSVVTDNGIDKVITTQRITPVTLADLFMAIGVIIITAIAAKNIPGLLEITVLRRLPVEFGTRFAITSVSRYIIIIAGIVISCSMISIGWSKVQWLAAAISVGLGFGLQEIFSNFISGLIILFEQPIRVGDTVTVDDVSGTITKIKSRATTITTWERKEMIVPNKEFITSRLVNWTLSDRILRVEIPVGIAYGSDTQKAHDVLMEVAAGHPMVIADPAPMVLFLRFDDSALYFELRAFITDIESFLQIKHELHMQVDQALRNADITIAFPQRDIHIKTIDGKIPAQCKIEDGGNQQG